MKIYHIIPVILFTILLSTCSRTNITPTFDRFYLRHEGADIAVQVDGNRASNTFIVVLHGGPGGGAAVYNSGRAVDDLERDYAMVYMDQRGQGASQGKYEKEDLTLQQISEDIYALTLLLKEKYGSDISIFLMGHSWGGLTGTHVLLNTEIQNEIKGWIEVNGAHDYILNDIETVKMFLDIGGDELAAGREVDFWEELIQTVQAYDTNQITNDQSLYLNQQAFEAETLIEEVFEPEIVDEFAYGTFNSPDISMSAWMSNVLSASTLNDESAITPLTDELHLIQIPSLLLWGKYDFVVPPALGVSAMERIGTTDKELIIFENSGHSPMSNQPREFAEEVKRFVEKWR